MKQTVEEAAREAIHAHYNCNGKYPCRERDYCEYCNGHNTAFDCCECGADEFKEGFIAGAGWKSKKSPWISVEERLPEIVTEDGESDYMLVRHNGLIPVIAKYCTEEYHVCPTFKLGHKIYRSHWITPTFNWIKFNVTHYMPIPSFDEILEANRDVLERIKEK